MLRFKVRAAYEGITAEIKRMRVQAPIGTRENGLRKIRSSPEDGSTACCEYRKRAGSRRADKGGSWLPVTACISFRGQKETTALTVDQFTMVFELQRVEEERKERK